MDKLLNWTRFFLVRANIFASFQSMRIKSMKKLKLNYALNNQNPVNYYDILQKI